MKTERDDIDKRLLLRVLAADYGLVLHQIAFMPRGEEAYTYAAHAADGASFFVRLQPAQQAHHLEQVYSILRDLQRQGLGEVLAPIETRAGKSTIMLGGYLVAVFRFVEGVTLYQRGATASDIGAAAALIARLHRTPLARLLPREEFANPFAQPITEALTAAAAGRSWAPLQEQACRLLVAERADVVAALELMERLGRQARQQAHDWVPTHGDPNQDNFLADRQGTLHLTDWGELAIGPPERDLTHFTGDTFDIALRHYIGVRPLTPHIELFAFYAYRWSMQEIADYATRLLFRDLGAAENEHAWVELQSYLPLRHDAIADGLRATERVIDKVLR